MVFNPPKLALGAWLALLLGACSSDHRTLSAPATRGLTISGAVQTEGGLPIAGATVCFLGKNSCVVTDELGAYQTAHDNSVADPMVVSFVAPGYARRTARMNHAMAKQGPVALRAIDNYTRVTLPAAGEAAVKVSVNRGDASSTLTIPAASLVDPNGVPAAGNANVSLTFWHPLQPLQSAPANLFTLASDGNGRKGLTTFGMATIEIEQNGGLLQVIAGQSLGWDVVEPPTVASALLPDSQVKVPFPDLYAVDPNTGIWQLEGTAATGAIAFDADTRTLTTKLPHLSSWNIDSDAGPDFGGCISGRIVDPCGQPNPGAAFTVWYLGYEELKDWPGNVANSDGTFCLNTFMSSWNITGNNTNINYFISGADSFTDTAMCNPAPASCFTCVDENAPYSTMGWCTNCILDPAGAAPPPAYGEPPTYYSNTCNAPSINLIPYSNCASANCVAVGDIQLSSSTCETKVGTGVNGNDPNIVASTPSTPATSTPDPCASGGTGKSLGAFCGPSDTCCPRDTLVCSDKLCVPAQDPAIVVR